MKAFLPVVIAAAISAPALAQSNRVSLGFSTFTANTASASLPDQRQVQSSRSIRILPVVGYHRMLNSRLGLGLELGYSRFSSRVNTTQENWGTLQQFTNLESKTSFNEYYVCPSVFTLITTADRKFRFIPALSVPVNIQTDIRGENFSQNVIQQTGEVTASTRSINAPQQAISIGLIAGGSAQYRIAGNLYTGLQLGAGVVYGMQKAKGDATTIHNEGLDNEFRNNQPVDNKTTGFNFQFQPAIVFNYFF